MIWAGFGYDEKAPLDSRPIQTFIARKFWNRLKNSHKSTMEWKWLAEHFLDFINKDKWSPSSPDLNSLDYSVWSIIESETNAQQHTAMESLRRAILLAFENLDQEMINRAIDDWPRRLDAAIEQQGGHFE
uniref:Gag protein n=1 Tax=Ditylenchus dipsaci TaxID=166011 RepID=A0A915D8S3_9BILA